MTVDPSSKKAYIHPKALVETRSIGPGTRVWAFAHVMKGALVGRDCNLGDHSFVEGGVSIGDRVTIKNGVSVWNGVTIENDVFVGPNVAFTNDRYPVSRQTDYKLELTTIGRGSAIGANATIVCGVVIGPNVMVGAGSVVTKSIPANALVYGNPAKVHGYLCDCRKKIKFAGVCARCACGLTYKKSSKGIRRA